MHTIANLLGIVIFLLFEQFVNASPRPQSSYNVKFSSPTQNYAHGVEIASPVGVYSHLERISTYNPTRSHGYDIVSQPALVRGPRKFVYPSQRRLITNQPQETNFLQPSNDISTQLAFDSIQQPQYYTDAQQLDNEIHDPLLLTGEDAVAAVKYLFGRGELYWDNIPHSRALERHQEERRINGLELHRLSSNRLESPYFRGGLPYGASKQRRRGYYVYQ